MLHGHEVGSGMKKVYVMWVDGLERKLDAGRKEGRKTAVGKFRGIIFRLPSPWRLREHRKPGYESSCTQLFIVS